jgi:Na+-translocating ferredoxin:NAD+ oxidoreductase RnfG subunit
MLGTNPTVTKINSLTVLEQKETPGLGAKITDEESFLKYWLNKDCSESLSLRKPAVSSPEELSSSEINTITGATISSEAVLKTANSSLEKVRKLKEGGQLKTEEENAR